MRRPHTIRFRPQALGLLAILTLAWACADPSGSGSNGIAGGPAPSGTGGAAGVAMQPVGGMLAGTAGVAGVMAVGGMDAAQGGIGGTAGTSGSLDAGSVVDSGAQDSDASAIDAVVDDPIGYAGELDGLFLDAPCLDSTPLPLAMGATCDHPTATQHIEHAIAFGGEPGVTYAVALRVRGIWEPTTIAGGQAPDPALPFKVGGAVAGGGAIDYQQYSIVVSAPAQTYWLNDHQYLAHDIHKLDYEATIYVTGGATVTVIMNDGNEREIANWTKDYFAGLPPYDTAPSTGQSLHLDVISVEPE